VMVMVMVMIAVMAGVLVIVVIRRLVRVMGHARDDGGGGSNIVPR
jgi:hypothetical protein